VLRVGQKIVSYGISTQIVVNNNNIYLCIYVYNTYKTIVQQQLIAINNFKKSIMSHSPKKKKNKKGHKKKTVKEEKDALQEVDRTMYNIQIADLTEKLGR